MIKSIKTKIILLLSFSVVIISISMGIVSCVLNFQTSMNVMEETITDTASVAANQVVEALEGRLNIVVETGGNARLAGDSVPLADKREIIDQKMSAYGFADGGVVDSTGRSLFDPAVDVSEEEYFKAAMRGETYVTDPIMNEKVGKLAILMTAPLWADGKPGTTVVGMVYLSPEPDFLNNLVNSITIGKYGTAYIINRDGTTIAYNDDQIVQQRYNTQEEAKKDSKLLPLAALERRMINGETGFGHYSYDGVTKVMAFSPVQGTDGWSLTVCAGRNEFLSGVFRSIVFTVILIAVFLAAGIFVAVMAGRKIADPVTLCADRLELLARGDLKSPVPKVRNRDETGRLADATDTIVTTLGQIVGDMGWCLEKLADGDFTAESRNQELYIGDFQPMLVSLSRIISQLSEILYQVRTAAEQVSGGSGQVSIGAQALSQGATEQASSVEELAATLSEISVHVMDTAHNAAISRDQTAGAGDEVTLCNRQMNEMQEAMEEISSKSHEIGIIIKTIEDIAFQTNILALNAAVEAARAGSAGKGFAVVADEVRNLAGKSAEASKNTSELIAGSIKAVERGTRVAKETAGTLLRVVESAHAVATTVERIADAANDQALSIEQVTQGIDQISGVVQNNSATAEESAAASEELSAQAQMLKELVGKFVIGDRG